MDTNRWNLNKRIRSFGYAFTGLYELVKSEPNAQIHLLATICVIIAGFYFHISRQEWCVVIFAIAIVFAAEAINTAIEKLADHLFPERHETARVAKDVAAGAVLICAIAAVICGLIIFLPKVLGN